MVKQRINLSLFIGLKLTKVPSRAFIQNSVKDDQILDTSSSEIQNFSFRHKKYRKNDLQYNIILCTANKYLSRYSARVSSLSKKNKLTLI